MKTRPVKHIELFYSSFSGDELFRQELETHLSPLVRKGFLSTWHESQIVPGKEKQREIDKHFSAAQVIVLLVSPNFTNSDLCNEQMEQALIFEEAGTKRVVPILIRPTNVEWTALKGRQLLPANDKPINSWSNRDTIWGTVAGQIGQTVMKLLEPTPSQSDPDQAGSDTSTSSDSDLTSTKPAETTSASRSLPDQDHPSLFRPPSSFLQEIKIPSFGTHFLDTGNRSRSDDRDYLARIIKTVIDPMATPAMQNLLRGKLPSDLIDRINYREASRNIADTMLDYLEVGGTLTPSTHALGAFFRDLLVKPSNPISYDDSVKIVALLFHYTLLTDPEEIAELSALFQVPSPVLTRNELLARPLSYTTSPAQPDMEGLQEQFETIYNKYNHILDVKFLEQGAKAARAVCRIDFDQQGEGTGFLVAPNLVLTNYHIMNPPGHQGDLQERARRCEVRFGMIDGVSAGTPFKLHKDNWLLEASESEDLDFMLLQLNRSVTANSVIAPLVVEARSVQKGEFVNIIQHPRGQAMQVSLRFNKVTRVLEKRIYYLADTEEGSSGSPVFDDSWQLVALHHAGGIQDALGNQIVAANIGVPIKLIRDKILKYLPG